MNNENSVIALKYDKKDVLSQRRPRDARYISRSWGRRRQSYSSESKSVAFSVTGGALKIGGLNPCWLSLFKLINDLGWPWRVIMHPVSKHVRHGVVIYLFLVSHPVGFYSTKQKTVAWPFLSWCKLLYSLFQTDKPLLNKLINSKYWKKQSVRNAIERLC